MVKKFWLFSHDEGNVRSEAFWVGCRANMQGHHSMFCLALIWLSCTTFQIAVQLGNFVVWKLLSL